MKKKNNSLAQGSSDASEGKSNLYKGRSSRQQAARLWLVHRLESSINLWIKIGNTAKSRLKSTVVYIAFDIQRRFDYLLTKWRLIRIID